MILEEASSRLLVFGATPCAFYNTKKSSGWILEVACNLQLAGLGVGVFRILGGGGGAGGESCNRVQQPRKEVLIKEVCGAVWMRCWVKRSLTPRCSICGGSDVVEAISMFAVGAAGENGEHSNCVKGCIRIRISGNEGMLRTFLHHARVILYW